jgi:hypothetical protein
MTSHHKFMRGCGIENSLREPRKAFAEEEKLERKIAAKKKVRRRKKSMGIRRILTRGEEFASSANCTSSWHGDNLRGLSSDPEMMIAPFLVTKPDDHSRKQIVRFFLFHLSITIMRDG